MLSIGPPKTPQAAKEYLTRDDPYFGNRNAAWFGRAAESLGLTNLFDEEVFQFLLAGSDPEGRPLARAGGPRRTRISGFDLTFAESVMIQSKSLVNRHSGERGCRKTRIEVLERIFLLVTAAPLRVWWLTWLTVFLFKTVQKTNSQAKRTYLPEYESKNRRKMNTLA